MVWYIEKLNKFFKKSKIGISFKSKIKFKLSIILDKLFGYCWADLVIWSLGYMDFIDVSKKGCCDNQAYYYCEHCEVNE